MTDILPGDLDAMIGVLDRLSEESDSLSVEHAIQMMELLNLVQSALRRTQSLIETQAKAQLEKPKIFHNRRYVKATKYTTRYEHHRIAKRVADRVKVDGETGEILSAQEQVARALSMMIRLYLNDSSTAKKGEMKKLLGVGDALEENLAWDQATGTEIRVYDLDDTGH